MNKDSVISSYYLYLTALLRKSGSQVNKAIEELNKAYMKEPTSWELVCMLIDIDPEYKTTEKLQVLERHLQQRCEPGNSVLAGIPVFSGEANLSEKALGI